MMLFDMLVVANSSLKFIAFKILGAFRSLVALRCTHREFFYNVPKKYGRLPTWQCLESYYSSCQPFWRRD